MTDIEHVVSQLRRVGLRPSERQWEIIREAGTTAQPALMELALDVNLLTQPEPASLGPVHALRLLAELPAPAAETIDRLLRAVPPDTDLSEQAAFIWWQELPQIVARWGRPSYEVAREVLLDETAGKEQRALAAETIGYTVEIDNTLRNDAIAFLRERLGIESDPYVMAHVIEALANIRAWKTYEDVMAAYKRGAVDKETLPAADARQRLLASKPHPSLACLRHPLEERYDKHGPFSEEQRQEMSQRYNAMA
jgi:hypothetical protein